MLSSILPHHFPRSVLCVYDCALLTRIAIFYLHKAVLFGAGVVILYTRPKNETYTLFRKQKKHVEFLLCAAEKRR